MPTAKIQYTVDIDDIPTEIKKRLFHLSAMTKSITSSLEQLSTKDLNLLEDSRKVNDLRRALLVVDSNLDDCYNALVGLANYQSGLLKEERETENGAETNEPSGA